MAPEDTPPTIVASQSIASSRNRAAASAPAEPPRSQVTRRYPTAASGGPNARVTKSAVEADPWATSAAGASGSPTTTGVSEATTASSRSAVRCQHGGGHLDEPAEAGHPAHHRARDRARRRGTA